VNSVPNSGLKVTIFAGDLYWKYDLSQSPKVSTSYPKPTTTNWGGVEGLFDDVLYVNSGYIYFFTTNRTYYRYNCATALVRGNETNSSVRELRK
jgi:hypothetical protein